MKRSAESSLAGWFNSRRRKPLVLRGARQVGKSTLVRQFAAAHDLELNEINLERHSELDEVFKTLDISAIRNELDVLAGRSVTAPGSLLFLDEIQAVPSALQTLRYFYEDLPDLPVIAAGSLLEFTLADHNFSMPVGRVEYLHLGPMSFREFLEAVEPSLCRLLDLIDFDSALPITAHEKLQMRQKQYFFAGGMPEAVLAFKESGSLKDSTEVHSRILNTYEDDFAKYAKQKDLRLLQRIFRMIPQRVGEKVKYVNFSREERSRDIKAAIDLLVKARVCFSVHAGHCSGVPLYADIRMSVYKLLFLDVGLMNHVCGLNWSILNGLNYVNLINDGSVAEQYIGQHLAYYGDGRDSPHLVYWLREGKGRNAEVDYVFSCGTEIIPIEVKSGKSGSLRSLHQFAAAKRTVRAVRFDMNQPSRQRVSQRVAVRDGYTDVSFELLSLPLYAVCELERLLLSEL
jgi:predicted AAA+ superfamily ATPase